MNTSTYSNECTSKPVIYTGLKGGKELKYSVVQMPYVDMPSGLSWSEQERRRNELFLGCCCYGCRGDECGDGQ